MIQNICLQIAFRRHWALVRSRTRTAGQVASEVYTHLKHLFFILSQIKKQKSISQTIYHNLSQSTAQHKSFNVISKTGPQLQLSFENPRTTIFELCLFFLLSFLFSWVQLSYSWNIISYFYAFQNSEIPGLESKNHSIFVPHNKL